MGSSPPHIIFYKTTNCYDKELSWNNIPPFLNKSEIHWAHNENIDDYAIEHHGY